MFINLLKADIKFITRDPVLLVAAIAPLFLILFLRLAFTPLSDFIFMKTGFQPESYYTIIAVTMVSIIPMLYGMAYAFILLDENDLRRHNVISVTPVGKKNLLYMRMLVPAFLSFTVLLITAFLTDPVPTEGWLRTVYISFLLAFQAPFVCLFISSLNGKKINRRVLSKLYGIFLVAVPFGLMVHHPWNYFAFFSPLYWISWAWVSHSPVESLIYGSISMMITFGCIIWFFSLFIKKNTN